MIPYAGEMKTPTIPDALLAEASEAVIKALQRAFDEGYERGRLDAVNRVMAAAQGIATGPIEAMARGYDVPKSLIGGAGGGGEKVHPNAAEKRRFPYGAVAEAFRTALKRAGPFGASRDSLIEWVSQILGEDVSDMNHRDTLKRLKKSGHLTMRAGRYFAGPALLGQNENGAAEAAPDADEGATSSNDSQGRLPDVG